MCQASNANRHAGRDIPLRAPRTQMHSMKCTKKLMRGAQANRLGVAGQAKAIGQNMQKKKHFGLPLAFQQQVHLKKLANHLLGTLKRGRKLAGFKLQNYLLPPPATEHKTLI